MQINRITSEAVSKFAVPSIVHIKESHLSKKQDSGETKYTDKQKDFSLF